MSKRVVVYIGNSNCYHMMKLSAKSLLCNTAVDKIYFMIDDREFPVNLPEIIKCIPVYNQCYFEESCPNMHAFYSYMTLMRTTLSKLLMDDMVLLLDPDTVVCGSLDGLGDYNLNDYYFAAVPETRVSVHEKQPYYNAGVMLMNLVKLRTEHMDDIIIDELNRQRYAHLEQDVLNYQCDGKILALPSDYNASFVTDVTNNPLIKHFLSDDKHLYMRNVKQYSSMNWAEVMERQNKLKGE